MTRRKHGVAPVVSFLALAARASLQSKPAPLPPAQNPVAKPQVTFNRDVATILFRYCATCHLPGEAGPLPLLTYRDARSHARQIATVTQSRFMPPWLPEPGEFKFADELRLSEKEIKLIADWVEAGAMQGEPADLPPAPKFVEGWQIGKPDLILKAEKPYQQPAKGTNRYWNFIFRTPVNQTRWLKGMEFRPAHN